MYGALLKASARLSLTNTLKVPEGEYIKAVVRLGMVRPFCLSFYYDHTLNIIFCFKLSLQKCNLFTRKTFFAVLHLWKTWQQI